MLENSHKKKHWEEKVICIITMITGMNNFVMDFYIKVKTIYEMWNKGKRIQLPYGDKLRCVNILRCNFQFL